MTAREIAEGGKSVYGARLGILLLETRFPRIPGDIRNARTWPFPVLYHVVRGASPDRVVRDRANGLLPAFIEGARAVVALGADGITSSCGFLSLFQREIASAIGVPVAISSLMQVPLVERLLPAGKRVGILTISAATLSPEHLEAAGVARDTPIIGTDGGREFSRAILGDEPRLDIAAAERDILEAGDALLARHPDIGAIVLECTNMAPYARALARHVHRPVFDIVSFLTWFHAGLQPRDFSWSEA
ncbi:MAG TPA: aspartate/glutamate racemase family protein [Stellaceae bacterium]|nr:aspartate/glutamate racemase family protein [Stellaceae bacterium]